MWNGKEYNKDKKFCTNIFGYFVFTSSILAIDKAKWVQLNGKTKRVLKNVPYMLE